MDVRATAKYLPISPQKIRLVCDQVRGMEPLKASDTLKFMPQKGARYIYKVLQSAIANAENNFELDAADMVISAVYADEGPRRPGRRFGARGRFKPLIHRTAHVTVVLSEVLYSFDDEEDFEEDEVVVEDNVVVEDEVEEAVDEEVVDGDDDEEVVDDEAAEDGEDEQES